MVAVDTAVSGIVEFPRIVLMKGIVRLMVCVTVTLMPFPAQAAPKSWLLTVTVPVTAKFTGVVELVRTRDSIPAESVGFNDPCKAPSSAASRTAI